MSHTPAERVLFSDLTRLFSSMRDAAFADLEACIEDRFRCFVRTEAAEDPNADVASLQITLTWTLPDGADDWAVYATEYKTLPAMREDRSRKAAAGGLDEASVIEFPASQTRNAARPNGASARIIAFPG
jgi:hypothetical protein